MLSANCVESCSAWVERNGPAPKKGPELKDVYKKVNGKRVAVKNKQGKTEQQLQIHVAEDPDRLQHVTEKKVRTNYLFKFHAL